MSRRASVFARQNPGKRRVRFPDEVVFEESIKESDGMAIMALLRRASVDIDVNRINMAGMTALHQVLRNFGNSRMDYSPLFVFELHFFICLRISCVVCNYRHVCGQRLKYL